MLIITNLLLVFGNKDWFVWIYGLSLKKFATVESDNISQNIYENLLKIHAGKVFCLYKSDIYQMFLISIAGKQGQGEEEVRNKKRDRQIERDGHSLPEEPSPLQIPAWPCSLVFIAHLILCNETREQVSVPVSKDKNKDITKSTTLSKEEMKKFLRK